MKRHLSQWPVISLTEALHQISEKEENKQELHSFVMSGRQRSRENKILRAMSDPFHTIWQTMNITTSPTVGVTHCSIRQSIRIQLSNKNSVRRAFAKINKLNTTKQIVDSLFSIKIYQKNLSKNLSIDSCFSFHRKKSFITQIFGFESYFGFIQSWYHFLKLGNISIKFILNSKNNTYDCFFNIKFKNS